jgi:hypothetical protein
MGANCGDYLMRNRIASGGRRSCRHTASQPADIKERNMTEIAANIANVALTDLADRYLAAWNETDAARRRDLIGRAWTESAVYVDPLMRGEGHAGIDAMIAGVQARFPGFQFRRVTPVDAHGEHMRFTWELGPAGEAALVVGTDFATVSADGRLKGMTGFIDRAPAGLDG